MSLTKITSQQLSHINLESVRSLLSGLVIGYRPEFAHIGRGTELGCIGIKAALMLSQALWLTERRGDKDGWFPYTLVEWFQSTGLSDEEQLTARRALKKRGLLQESDRGVDFTLHGRRRRTGGQKHYRIDFYGLAAALDDVAEGGFLGPDGGSALPLPAADGITDNSVSASTKSSSDSDLEASDKSQSSLELCRAGNRSNVSGRFQKVFPAKSDHSPLMASKTKPLQQQLPANPEATSPVPRGASPFTPGEPLWTLPVSVGEHLPGKPEAPALYTESIKDKQQQQRETAKMFVVVENLKNSDLAPLAPMPTNGDPKQSVKAQLLEFTSSRNMLVTSDETEALLGSWPAAKLSDADLFGALTGDYELYSLDRPADERIARAAIKSDAARLRWFMCVWPGFEEASDAYHDKTGHRWTKAQCFWKRWKNAQPPANWLEYRLKALRGTVEAARVESEARTYKTFWNALTAPQRRKLDNETREVLNEAGGGEYFAQSSDEFLAKRRELLLDDEVREWLMDGGEQAPGLWNQIKNAAATAATSEMSAVARDTSPVVDDNCDGVRGASDGFCGALESGGGRDGSDDVCADLDASYSDSGAGENGRCAEEGMVLELEYDEADWPTRQLSIEVYIGPLMNQLRDKTLVLDDLEEMRPNLLDEDEWRFIKDETTRRAYAEEIVA